MSTAPKTRIASVITLLEYQRSDLQLHVIKMFFVNPVGTYDHMHILFEKINESKRELPSFYLLLTVTINDTFAGRMQV